MKHNLTCDDSHIPAARNVLYLSCVSTCTTHKPYQKKNHVQGISCVANVHLLIPNEPPQWSMLTQPLTS
jgi:hypothetical protein